MFALRVLYSEMKFECIHCNSVMDRTNFTDFIMQSDNDKNSVQEATVQYHTWRLLPEDNPRPLMPEL
jgi:hypothetical protein